MYLKKKKNLFETFPMGDEGHILPWAGHDYYEWIWLFLSDVAIFF